MRRQRIVEEVNCDKCGELTDDPTSSTVEIASSGAGMPLRRMLDLCRTCAPIVDELRELMRRLPPNGPRDRQPPRDPGDGVACGVCGVELARAHLSGHLVKKHGAVVRQPKQCPDCDKQFAGPDMLRHRTRTHGYNHVNALLSTLALPTGKRRR